MATKEQKKRWKYVVTLKTGDKIFSDQVLGDYNEKGGSIVVVKTKVDGTEFARTTVSNDQVAMVDVATGV